MENKKRFYFDTETTGTNPNIPGIHQISGFIEINDKIIEAFNFKLKPWDACIYDDEALAVCNVTKEQIMEYPPEEEGYSNIFNLICKYTEQFSKQDKFTFVGYNVKFDIDMLYSLFIRNNNKFMFGLFWGNPLEIMSLATLKFEKIRHLMPNFKLITVAKTAGLDIEDDKLHDAMYDIIVTRDLLLKLLTKNNDMDKEKTRVFLQNNAVVNKVTKENQLLKRTDVFNRGKYKGQVLDSVLDMDASYLSYCIREWDDIDFEADFIEEVEQIIEAKKYN